MLNRIFPLPALLAGFLVIAAQAAIGADRTQDLVRVLQSDAALFEKARACQQLGEFGDADAVPALAALLSDEKLGSFARSGLEGIPDPRAAAALRQATQNLKGSALAGVVQSLGAIRDQAAVELLGRLAADSKSGVANEAMLALGNISNLESLRLLQDIMMKGADLSKSSIASACLLAADRQLFAGDAHLALGFYELLRSKPGVPLACRVGATRGSILARNADRVPFLLQQLNSSELAIRNAALFTIREIPSDVLAAALNREVQRARPELQALLLEALADCHNSESAGVIQALSESGDGTVRKTALAVLGRMGSDAGPGLIAALMKDRAPEEKTILLASLRSLPGPEVNSLLVKALSSEAPRAVRLSLIGLLDDRGVTSAAPSLLAQATATEKDVRVAALSALRLLGTAQQVPALLDVTKKAGDPEVRDAAENALSGICSRSGDSACQRVLAELQQASVNADRNSWIRVLARGGCGHALTAVETAVNDSDPAVASNALVELGRWPDPAPMNTLLKVTESASAPALKKQALASVFDLAGVALDDNQASAATVVDWLRRAKPAAGTTPEKLRLLGLLGRLKTMESYRLLSPYLEDAAVQTEAASAIVQIAANLTAEPDAAALKVALGKIADSATDADLRNRAAQLAKTVAAASEPVVLFKDGTLHGWEGDMKVWRVRDGVIVGGSLAGNPRNEFLATTRSYTNFVLRLEYKLAGTEGFVNSGVQFRSVRVSNPPNEMSGYQADIGAGYSGCLYDESRRNNFLVRASEEMIKRVEKPGDWNEYEIQCEGRHIQIRLNGVKTVDYSELDGSIPLSGLIALQIHGGNKAEVSFRKITLREL